MKLKLGLLIGGAIGYAVGSGKARQWWQSMQSSMDDRRRTSSPVSWTDEAMGSTARPSDDAVHVTETVISTV